MHAEAQAVICYPCLSDLFSCSNVNSASPLRIEGSSIICVGGEVKRGEKDERTNERRENV